MKEILERIEQDAKAEAAALIEAAKNQAAENLKQAQEQIRLDEIAKLEKAQSFIVLEQERLDQIRRNDMVRAVLGEKQEIIDEVFEGARKELSKLSATDAKKLVDNLTKKYVGAEDTVKTVGVGIVVSNPKFEVKLTLDELLEMLREQIEADVAKMLFTEQGA